MATATVTKVIEIDVKQSAQTQAAVKGLAADMKSLDDTVGKAGKNIGGSLDFITNGLKSMAQGFVIGSITAGVVSLVSSLRDMGDSAQVLRSRLEQVTGSLANANIGFQDAIRISVKHGQSLEAVGTLYEKMARSADKLGVTQAGVSAITDAFAASLRLSGAGTQQAEAAILQFSQALAAGKLAGDEYRSMTENNSVFMTELGKATGKSAGELKKMSKDGDIDLAFLRKAFTATDKDGNTMLDRLNENAAKLPLTFKQAREGVVSQLTNLVDALTNTANAGESIFTRMARVISSSLGQAADEVRAYASADLARKAAETGKAIPQAPTISDGQRFIGSLYNQAEELRKSADEKFARAKDPAYLRMIGGGRTDIPGVNAKGGADMVAQELIRKARGDLAAANALMDERKKLMERAQKEQAGLTVNEILTQNWKEDPKAPKKPKKEKAAEVDSIDQFSMDLMRKDINNDLKREGMGKNELALQVALDKTKKSASELSAILPRLTEQAKALDDAIKLSKYNDDVQDFMTKSYKAQKKADEDSKNLMVAEGEKLLKKVDPLADFLKKVEEADAMIARFGQEGFGTTEQLDAIIAYRENLNLATHDLDKVAEKGKTTAEEIRDAMINGTKDMADAFVQFAMGAEVSFTKLIKKIVSDLASAQLQRLLDPLKKEGTNWLTNFLTPAAKAGASAGTGSSMGGIFDVIKGGMGDALGAIYGNTGAGRMTAFAKGGIVGSPTMFGHSGDQLGLMGEAGPEAIMPVKRDSSGKLGLSTAPVTVVINNYSDARVTQSEGTDQNGNKQIVLLIEKTVNDGINNGAYDSSMQNSFGSRRLGR